MFKAKISKYCLNLNYFLIRKNWLISLKDPFLNGNFNTEDFLEGKEIKSDKNEKIWLYSNKKIKKGWYFFGILHFGDNKTCITNVSSTFFFKQGRPTFPYRRRWRVIRQPKYSHLVIEVNQIKSKIKINEIWLIPIPFFIAWGKIKRKILSLTSYKFVNSINKVYLWKNYNNLFKKQIKKYKEFSYKDWRNFVENSLISDLEKKKYKKCNWVLLENLEGNDLKQNKWIIALKSNVKLSKRIDKILNFINESNENIDIAYGDEDHLSSFNERVEPIFKPAWNKELFWSDPFYSSHWIISSELWNKIFNENFSYKNISFEKLIFTIIGYLIRNKRESFIKHIPFVLSHRLENFYKGFTISKYKKDLINHIIDTTSQKISFLKVPKDSKNLTLNWPLAKDSLLSVIIPTKDKLSILKKCIDSIYKYKSGCDLEIIILNNDSKSIDTLNFLKEFKQNPKNNNIHRVLDYKGKFNYSKINNYAVKNSTGDTILLLNNDIEFKSSNWGFFLSSNANRRDIGCVGAKLFFEDKTIQHAGVILGIGGVAGHSHKYSNLNSNGYCGRLNLAQEYSAVTAACLCITKSKWISLRGLDEVNLPVNYNDVDFCLRAMQSKLKNIYLPHVQAIHLESKTRGKPQGEEYRRWRKEYKFMKRKWADILTKDPFYSPYLSKDKEDWSITINESKIFIR